MFLRLGRRSQGREGAWALQPPNPHPFGPAAKARLMLRWFDVEHGAAHMAHMCRTGAVRGCRGASAVPTQGKWSAVRAGTMRIGTPGKSRSRVGQSALRDPAAPASSLAGGEGGDP